MQRSASQNLLRRSPLLLLFALAATRGQTEPASIPPAATVPAATAPIATLPARFPADDFTDHSTELSEPDPAGGPVPAANFSHPPISDGDHDIDKHVMCLAQDLTGRVWVGTELNGIWCCDPEAQPPNQWRRYTMQDGLSGNEISSIGIDRLGRVWAGHSKSGLSIFNGEKWQSYEAAAGLSRPDSRAGPLGERVFAFATSPLDGDMWIGTSAGIARYSLTKDTWTYFTRADGLPSDQINTLAFDKSGLLFVGTQSDGIAIGKPNDGYKSWVHVKGPDTLPAAAVGRGLPSNLISQILVSSDGSIYVATLGGLGKSVDHGVTWVFTRGTDWTRKVAMQNTPAAKTAPKDPVWPPYVLKEDHLTCLAEDDAGRIFIGNRDAGYQVLIPPDPRTPKSAPNAGLATAGTLESAPVIRVDKAGKLPPFVTALLPRRGRVFVGLYEGGLQEFNPPGTYAASPAAPPPAIAAGALPAEFPASAAPPSASDLRALSAKINALSASPRPAAIYIGDDWRTQGDWVNHYGRQYAVLGAALGPFDEFITNSSAYYRIYPLVGSNRRPDEGLRRWIHAFSDPQNLYDPALGRPSETEWDDHGETYLLPIDGPDIHFEVTVPAGVSRVSIFFANQKGRYNAERWRDFEILVRHIPLELGGKQGAAPLHGPLESDPLALPPSPVPLSPGVVAPASWNASPVLARARVKDFYGGVYKQFAVTGPGSFDFAVRRNYGYNTICSGVFIDRLSGPATSLDEATPLLLEGPAYEPAPAQLAPGESASPETAAAMELWGGLNAAQSNPAVQVIDYPARVLAYRAASASPELAENWRWALRIWTTDDRTRFKKAMADIWQYQMVHYPELHTGTHVDVLK